MIFNSNLWPEAVSVSNFLFPKCNIKSQNTSKNQMPLLDMQDAKEKPLSTESEDLDCCFVNVQCIQIKWNLLCLFDSELESDLIGIREHRL